MIKLVSDTIDKDDIKALCQWLSQETTPRLTKGPLTLELEIKWAAMVGTKYSVFVNSGSSAILLMLASMKAAGIGNKIVIPALSWGTDLSSAMLLDYNITLCDCNLVDMSVKLEHLEHIFKTENPDILLLVPVLGLVPRMDKIQELCKQYNVTLVEDVCESMGSQFKGQNLGTFGYASVFSMFFGHHISTIEGGFINTNDDAFYCQLLMQRSHGWSRDLSDVVKASLRNQYNISKFNDQYTFYAPGMNLRSTDLQAFLGLRAVDKLDDFVTKRNKNYNIMVEKFYDINKLNLPLSGEDIISSFAFPLVIDNHKQVLEKLRDKVETRPLIAGNLALHPIWTDSGRAPVYLPNANIIHRDGLYIPNHQDITEEDIDTMYQLCMEAEK